MQTLDNNIDNDGFFKCPSCKESWVPYPIIENIGEEKTQVYCNYGCGFIFLEDYHCQLTELEQLKKTIKLK